MRLRGRPGERLEHGAAVDQVLRDGARPRGALHRLEQGEQRRLVARAGVLAQRLSEREMLGFRPRRQPRRVGRQEGEGRVGIVLVLREVEADAPDEIPRRARLPQECLDGAVPGRELVTNGGGHPRTQIGEDGRRQVLAARHRRRRGGQRGQLVRRDLDLDLRAQGLRGPRWRTTARRTLARRRARSPTRRAEASPARRHPAGTRRARRRARSASRSARAMTRGQNPRIRRRGRALAGTARSKAPTSVRARRPPTFQAKPFDRGAGFRRQ